MHDIDHDHRPGHDHESHEHDRSDGDHDRHEHEDHGHHGHAHHDHGDEHGHDHEGHEHAHRAGFTGKITGLVYDKLGDFDGFLLQTDEGERAFDSRESGIEELAERAWGERIVTSVFVDEHEPWAPVRIVLRA